MSSFDLVRIDLNCSAMVNASKKRPLDACSSSSESALLNAIFERFRWASRKNNPAAAKSKARMLKDKIADARFNAGIWAKSF